MLRGAKVTGEEEGKEEDTLGPGGREYPQANTRLTPSATRRGRGRVWGGFILLYFTSRAGPARPFPGVLGGGSGRTTQKVSSSGVLPCCEGVFTPRNLCPEAETWLLRLRRAENCGTSDQTHTHSGPSDWSTPTPSPPVEELEVELVPSSAQPSPAQLPSASQTHSFDGVASQHHAVH